MWPTTVVSTSTSPQLERELVVLLVCPTAVVSTSTSPLSERRRPGGGVAVTSDVHVVSTIFALLSSLKLPMLWRCSHAASPWLHWLQQAGKCRWGRRLRGLLLLAVEELGWRLGSRLQPRLSMSVTPIQQEYEPRAGGALTRPAPNCDIFGPGRGCCHLSSTGARRAVSGHYGAA